MNSFWFMAGAAALGLFVLLIVAGRPLWPSLWTVLSNSLLGVGSLWLLAAGFIGSLTLPLNVFTIVTSTVLGLPGTLLCLAVKTFFIG